MLINICETCVFQEVKSRAASPFFVACLACEVDASLMRGTHFSYTACPFPFAASHLSASQTNLVNTLVGLNFADNLCACGTDLDLGFKLGVDCLKVPACSNSCAHVSIKSVPKLAGSHGDLTGAVIPVALATLRSVNGSNVPGLNNSNQSSSPRPHLFSQLTCLLTPRLSLLIHSLDIVAKVNIAPDHGELEPKMV